MADTALTIQNDSDKPARVCGWCGNAIVQAATGRPKIYCSPGCGQYAWRDRNPERWKKIGLRSADKKRSTVNKLRADREISPVDFRACACCSEYFRVTIYNRKFCSRDCFDATWIENNREKLRCYTKRWQDSNKPHCAKYARDRRARDPEYFAQLDREYRRNQSAQAALSILLLPVGDAKS